MEKIIYIDIQNEKDIIEIYNENTINHNLIDYILNNVNLKNDKSIKIVINNNCNFKIDIKDKLTLGLNLEYEKIINEHHRNNIIQILLLFMGIIFLFLSTFISEEFIWHELFIIGGWVPIWEMIDIELFKESKNRKMKKIIEKLINSEIIIENK